MKKALIILFIAISFQGIGQTITPVLYPLFMQGHGTSSPGDEQRIPYTCRMTISGLLPNTAYFYFNRWATSPTSPVQQGGIIFVEQFGNWRRSTSPDLGSPPNRDTLITDATGTYTGWFASESGIATDFTAGTQLYFRLVLNDGAGGISPATSLTATAPVTVLAWDDYFLPYDPTPFIGSGLRSANANAAWVPKNFMMFYDNVAGTGRPVSGTFVENDGTANTIANAYVGFYGATTTGINGFANRWGTIIPDDLPNGIQRIAQHSLSTGAMVNSCTDADGDWGGANGNTVNPAVGLTTPLVIDCIPVGLCNIILSTTQTNISCFGQSTGAVNLTVAGATSPVSYNWSNGTTTEDLTNIPSGTYTVTVTDANNCTATKTVTINQPTSALAAVAITTNATCATLNGSVNLTVSGGTSPYTYQWSNGAVTEDISGLAAGTYNVTITDANNCITLTSATVNSTGGPTATITGTVNILCFGQSTGSINVTVSGGASPYTFLWSNGAATEDITSLAAGTYNMTVTDANGCIGTASATITQPASAVSATATSTNATCGASNGSVTVSVTGGTAPYTYFWNNGATTAGISGLATGTYSVTVTDASGCTGATNVSVNNTGGPTVTISGTTNVFCFGQATGSVNVSVAGGTAPYTYLWNNGATSEDISGLAAGIYSITVTDFNGCATTSIATIIQPANAITANTTVTNVFCFGQNTGSINLAVNGGTPPYSFLWSNGATTEDISTLVANSYSVIITDASGCTASSGATIIQPSQIIAFESHTGIACFGGNSTVTISAAGGTSPYTGTGTFTQAAGTQSYVVTDANGCSSAVTAAIVQPTLLAATASSGIITCNDGTTTVIVAATGGTPPYAGTGSYTRGAGTWSFTVTDGNNCSATTTVTITATSTFVASAATGIIACNGSTTTVTITATGGNPPYAGTGTFTRGAGTWSFTVTDDIGCTAITTITITEPAAALVASSLPGIIACNGGNTTTVAVTASGGTAPYSGTGTFTTGPGPYSYTVTDANGCTAVTTGTITEPSRLIASAVAQPIAICGGESKVTVNATGGTPPYAYPGVGTYFRKAGTWNFMVTDARGCTATTTIIIPHPECLKVQPNPVSATLIVSHTKANAGATIRVFTINGSALIIKSVPEGAIQTTIDMERYAAGTYVLVFHNVDESQTVRFEKINE